MKLADGAAGKARGGGQLDRNVADYMARHGQALKRRISSCAYIMKWHHVI